MKPLFSHNFTWNGVPVTGRKLAKMLCCSATRLYDRAEECGSDRGEDILLILNKPIECKKKKMLWGGVQTYVADIAKEMGIKEFTLLSRLRQYGKDCCLTYFPGYIPVTLTKSKPTNKKTKTNLLPKYLVDGGGGNKAWSELSGKPRTGSLQNIQPCGTWESRQ